MKEEVIKTEDIICEDNNEGTQGDALMDLKCDALVGTEAHEEKNCFHKSKLPEDECTSMKMSPHLGELVWVKSEPTDETFEKEPELDDAMSFGYFEEHGKEEREPCLLEEDNEQWNSKFTCFYCGNESYCLKKLRAHIKTTHTGPKRISDQSKIYEAIIIYTCRYCGYRTNDNSQYSNHLRKHLAELPVTKKLTSSQEARADHHELRIKPRFRCPYCSFKTCDNEEIRHHMCSCHENRRPYHYLRERSISRENGTLVADKRKAIFHHCPECEYCASRSGTLKRHIMAKHTKERPYRCLLCNYQATQNETLRRHILAKHTKEKPHQCPRCDYSAVQVGTLKYHIKSKHNLSP